MKRDTTEEQIPTIPLKDGNIGQNNYTKNKLVPDLISNLKKNAMIGGIPQNYALNKKFNKLSEINELRNERKIQRQLSSERDKSVENEENRERAINLLQKNKEKLGILLSEKRKLTPDSAGSGSGSAGRKRMSTPQVKGTISDFSHATDSMKNSLRSIRRINSNSKERDNKIKDALHNNLSKNAQIPNFPSASRNLNAKIFENQNEKNGVERKDSLKRGRAETNWFGSRDKASAELFKQTENNENLFKRVLAQVNTDLVKRSYSLKLERVLGNDACPSSSNITSENTTERNIYKEDKENIKPKCTGNVLNSLHIQTNQAQNGFKCEEQDGNIENKGDTGGVLQEIGGIKNNKNTKVTPEQIEEIEIQTPLTQRITHSIWQIRRNAYRQIAHLFQTFQQPQNVPSPIDRNRNYGILNSISQITQSVSPFQLYHPWLNNIISDSNLIAQFEGLSTLLSYLQNTPSLPNNTLSLVSMLLEKVPINKPNFQDILLKILQNFIARDHAPHVIQELISKFTIKNSRLAIFSINVVIRTIDSDLIEDIDLKQVFKAAMNSLSHYNREIRKALLTLIQRIYANISDPLESLKANLKCGKPILEKELIYMLENTEKRSTISAGYEITLFRKAKGGAQFKEGHSKLNITKNEINLKNMNNGLNTTDKNGRTGGVCALNMGVNGNTTAHVINGNIVNKNMRMEMMDEETEGSKLIDTDSPQNSSMSAPPPSINLLNHIPEQFFKLKYQLTLDSKRKAIQQIHSLFNQLLNKKKQGIINISVLDYSILLLSFISLFQDSNVLVLLDALKAMEVFASLFYDYQSGYAFSFFNKKREIISVIVEKYKESKKAVADALNQCLLAFIYNATIPSELIIEVLMTKAETNKNPRMKNSAMTFLIDRIDDCQREIHKSQEEKNKYTTMEESIDYLFNGTCDNIANAKKKERLISAFNG